MTSRRPSTLRGPGWAQRSAKYGPVPADIASALEKLGIEIEEDNADEVWARCPLHVARVGHVDHNPSWSVNKQTGEQHCFSCGYGGSFVSLVYDALELTNWDDARRWVEDQGVDLDAVDDLPDSLDAPRHQSTGGQLVLPEEALNDFTTPPDSVLALRHLDNEMGRRAVHMYDIRFARRQRAFILPFRDPHSGVLWGWQEKYLTSGRRPMNWPDDVARGQTLFGAYRMPKRCMPILVESPLDAAVIYRDLFPEFWGLSGYGAGLTDGQMRCVIDIADEVIIALDDDEEGRNQSRRLHRQWADRINMWFLNYRVLAHYRKDPGEMSTNELRRAVDEAQHSTEWSG